VVFADFVCTYSYLAVEQIDRLAREVRRPAPVASSLAASRNAARGCPREQTPESAAKRERLHAWVKEMAPEHYPRMRFPEKRQWLLAFEALEFACDRERDFEFRRLSTI
jgi:hypothetical protein